MSDQLTNGVLATGLGLVVAVVLLIPVAAIQYRRDGRFGPGDILTLIAAAIYGLSLWTYTLLPLPATGDVTCKHPQLEFLGSFRAIFEEGFDGPASLLRNAAFLQIGFNVALFVPFGFFVQLILRRGVIVATVLGLAVSLLIETTQGTGVWGLYDCPYRLFDLDDLLVNTVGATAGSLASALFVARAPKAVRLPAEVTVGRRLIGMLCDVVFIGLVGFAAAAAYRGYHFYGPGDPALIEASTQRLWMFGFPALLEGVVVMLLGRTIGEWTVDLRTVGGHPAHVVPGRLIKWCVGVGGYAGLLAWSGPYALPVLVAFIVVSVVGVFPGRGHPGISNIAGGLRLEIDHD